MVDGDLGRGLQSFVESDAQCRGAENGADDDNRADARVLRAPPLVFDRRGRRGDERILGSRRGRRRFGRALLGHDGSRRLGLVAGRDQISGAGQDVPAAANGFGVESAGLLEADVLGDDHTIPFDSVEFASDAADLVGRAAATLGWRERGTAGAVLPHDDHRGLGLRLGSGRGSRIGILAPRLMFETAIATLGPVEWVAERVAFGLLLAENVGRWEAAEADLDGRTPALLMMAHGVAATVGRDLDTARRADQTDRLLAGPTDSLVGPDLRFGKVGNDKEHREHDHLFHVGFSPFVGSWAPKHSPRCFLNPRATTPESSFRNEQQAYAWEKGFFLIYLTRRTHSLL